MKASSMSDTPDIPTVEHVYDAVVDIGARRDLGDSPLGRRVIIDIVGGHFEGPLLKGRVLPGGADRQLHRRDGVRELDALYEMETHDGAVITVRNQVLIEDLPEGGRYARSVIRLTAPTGPYDWLNRRQFVGTLTPLRPAREAVRIGVWLLK